MTTYAEEIETHVKRAESLFQNAHDNVEDNSLNFRQFILELGVFQIEMAKFKLKLAQNNAFLDVPVPNSVETSKK